MWNSRSQLLHFTSVFEIKNAGTKNAIGIPFDLEKEKVLRGEAVPVMIAFCK